MFRLKIIRFITVTSLLSLVATLASPSPTLSQLNMLTGIQRLYNPRTNDHFYTADFQEAINAVRGGGYIHEGDIGGCIKNNPPLTTLPSNTTPLYRFFKPGVGHFYTQDANGRSAARRLGYTEEGTVCNVWRSSQRIQAPCALYRLYNPRSNRHFYTTSFSEQLRVRRNNGYIFEGIEGYLNTSNNRCGTYTGNIIR